MKNSSRYLDWSFCVHPSSFHYSQMRNNHKENAVHEWLTRQDDDHNRKNIRPTSIPVRNIKNDTPILANKKQHTTTTRFAYAFTLDIGLPEHMIEKQHKRNRLPVQSHKDMADIKKQSKKEINYGSMMPQNWPSSSIIVSCSISGSVSLGSRS